MVVVEGGGIKAGLIVDDLLGQQQVVIKSLETNYKRIDGLSGATILGNGDVALILDVSGLVKIGLDPGVKQTIKKKQLDLDAAKEVA
jgi:two-component system chemotaxis sensor kinase CheA